MEIKKVSSDHATDMLKNPLSFMFMAVVGCTVGHALMVPLGMFNVSAIAGEFLADNFFDLRHIFEEVAHAGMEGVCHSHGAEIVCH